MNDWQVLRDPLGLAPLNAQAKLLRISITLNIILSALVKPNERGWLNYQNKMTMGQWWPGSLRMRVLLQWMEQMCILMEFEWDRLEAMIFE